jgi:hypothetical protein
LDVQELARTHTKEAVEALVRGLDDPKHYVAAATALLDRGWGKPTQPIAGDEDRPAAIVFSWAPASQPEPQVIDAVTDADGTTSPLTLVWNGPETC